jgi:phospholipid/cholesterol/gamma-HCH transport system ATP-binding protein
LFLGLFSNLTKVKNFMSVLALENIFVSLDQKQILRGVNLHLEEAQHISILGPGGCGKSTLLKTILGIVKYQQGKITLFGEDLSGVSEQDQSKLLKKIGMAFQQGALFDFMTVKENIFFSMENMTNLSHAEMEERVTQMLHQVNLPHSANKLPSELSGGMRRRVGIVRALCTHPKLVLIDEPTAGLDPVTSTVVIDLILNLAESTGSTILCVTSNVEVAFRFAKKVAILHEGKILGFGSWNELHQLQNKWLNYFLDVRSSHFDHGDTSSSGR